MVPMLASLFGMLGGYLGGRVAIKEWETKEAKAWEEAKEEKEWETKEAKAKTWEEAKEEDQKARECWQAEKEAAAEAQAKKWEEAKKEVHKELQFDLETAVEGWNQKARAWQEAFVAYWRAENKTAEEAKAKSWEEAKEEDQKARECWQEFAMEELEIARKSIQKALLLDLEKAMEEWEAKKMKAEEEQWKKQRPPIPTDWPMNVKVHRDLEAHIIKRNKKVEGMESFSFPQFQFHIVSMSHCFEIVKRGCKGKMLELLPEGAKVRQNDFKVHLVHKDDQEEEEVPMDYDDQYSDFFSDEEDMIEHNIVLKLEVVGIKERAENWRKKKEAQKDKSLARGK